MSYKSSKLTGVDMTGGEINSVDYQIYYLVLCRFLQELDDKLFCTAKWLESEEEVARWIDIERCILRKLIAWVESIGDLPFPYGLVGLGLRSGPSMRP